MIDCLISQSRLLHAQAKKLKNATNTILLLQPEENDTTTLQTQTQKTDIKN